MNSSTLATRYAKALHQLSSTNGQFRQELNKVARQFEEVPELRTFLLAPQIRKQEKEQLLKKITGEKSNPLFVDFLFLLLRKGRIKELPNIARAYNHLIALQSDLLESKVISAIPLDDITKGKIKEMLEKSFQKKVEIEEKVNPDILGGLILMVGNQMLDASLQHQLEELKESLLDTPV